MNHTAIITLLAIILTIGCDVDALEEPYTPVVDAQVDAAGHEHLVDEFIQSYATRAEADCEPCRERGYPARVVCVETLSRTWDRNCLTRIIELDHVTTEAYIHCRTSAAEGYVQCLAVCLDDRDENRAIQDECWGVWGTSCDDVDDLSSTESIPLDACGE